MLLCKSALNYYFPFPGYNFLNPFACFSYLTNPNSWRLVFPSTTLSPHKEGAFLKLPSAVELCCIRRSILVICDSNLLVYMIKRAEKSRVFSQILKRGRLTCLLASRSVVRPWILSSGVELFFPFQRRTLWCRTPWRPNLCLNILMPGSLGAPEAAFYFSNEWIVAKFFLLSCWDLLSATSSSHSPAFWSKQHKLLLFQIIWRQLECLPSRAQFLHLFLHFSGFHIHFFFKWNLTLK